MNTITLQLSADTEQKLQDKARKLGQSLEVYLQQLAERAVEIRATSGPTHLEANGSSTPVANKSEGFPMFISRSKVTPDELDELLDQLSAGPTGKVHPPDFSRADIYDDHD